MRSEETSGEPVWLDAPIVLALHAEQIRLYLGEPGVRDHGLLDSALNRPRFRWEYERADVVRLAAAYGFANTKNHPFHDGNKRTGFMATYTFLGLNGLELVAAETAVVLIMERLAAGEASEEEFEAWVRGNVVPWEEGGSPSSSA